MSRIGNGRLDQVFVANQKSMTLSDTTMPCLAITWTARGRPAEVPTVIPHAATYTHDASEKTHVVKIKRKDQTGTALADVTYTITGGATKADWSSYAATAVTLKDLVDLLNEIPGIKAWALHAPWDMSVNITTTLDTSETYLQNANNIEGYGEFLYRDVSAHQVDSDYVAYMRVGLPEVRDRDSFQIIDIYGTITGVTNGKVIVYRDDYAEYVDPTGTFAIDIAKKEVLVEATAAATKSYGSGYVGANNLMVAPIVRGPLIVMVKSDDISACDLKVMIKQATVNP